MGPLRAFAYPQFRIFWAASLISITSFFMTMIARGWLALELTDSSFMVTAVNAVGMLPMLVLSAFGGVIADRMNRRLVLIASDVFNFVVVLALAVLIVADMVNIQLVFALTILHGVGFALGMPARAATVSNLVDQKDLASGVALFTTIFSAGMLVGPALAGYLINSFGMGTCFVAASIVLAPALVFLFLLRLPSGEPGFGVPARTSVLGSIVQGMDYVRRSRVLVGLMLMGTAATVFAMPYQTLLPVFARDILHAGAGGLGWLGAMGGAGAIAGSITVASFSNPKQLKALMITGGLGLGPFIALFAYSTLYLLSLAPCLGGGISVPDIYDQQLHTGADNLARLRTGPGAEHTHDRGRSGSCGNADAGSGRRNVGSACGHGLDGHPLAGLGMRDTRRHPIGEESGNYHGRRSAHSRQRKPRQPRPLPSCRGSWPAPSRLSIRPLRRRGRWTAPPQPEVSPRW